MAYLVLGCIVFSTTERCGNVVQKFTYQRYVVQWCMFYMCSDETNDHKPFKDGQSGRVVLLTSYKTIHNHTHTLTNSLAGIHTYPVTHTYMHTHARTQILAHSQPHTHSLGHCGQ